MTDFLIKPSVNNRSLFKLKKSINEKGEITKIPIIEEKPLTLYLNNQEHGCVLCQGDKPLYYFEDVGRHNAVDKIAGLILDKKIDAKEMSFYTTGRLTSEMVLKCIKMEIPILLSRSGFTAWAVEIARKKNLTMIGRIRGKRLNILSGEFRYTKDE